MHPNAPALLPPPLPPKSNSNLNTNSRPYSPTQNLSDSDSNDDDQNNRSRGRGRSRSRSISRSHSRSNSPSRSRSRSHSRSISRSRSRSRSSSSSRSRSRSRSRDRIRRRNDNNDDDRDRDYRDHRSVSPRDKRKSTDSNRKSSRDSRSRSRDRSSSSQNNNNSGSGGYNNDKKSSGHLYRDGRGKRLPQPQRDELISILRDINTSRHKILMAMGFSLELAEYALEVCDIITQSAVNPNGTIHSKIAKLFLISDILFNSSAVVNGSIYRKGFQENLPKVFESLGESFKSITGRISALNARDKVLRVIRGWESWSLYPQPFLNSLQASFLLDKESKNQPSSGSLLTSSLVDEELDGVPLYDAE